MVLVLIVILNTLLAARGADGARPICLHRSISIFGIREAGEGLRAEVFVPGAERAASLGKRVGLVEKLDLRVKCLRRNVPGKRNR